MQTDYIVDVVEMPIIPNIGDTIGFWHEDKWHLVTVLSRIFEFNEDGSYYRCELNGYS
jgi:hypothetical protein